MKELDDWKRELDRWNPRSEPDPRWPDAVAIGLAMAFIVWLVLLVFTDMGNL